MYCAYHPKKAVQYVILTQFMVIIADTLSNIRSRALENRNVKELGMFSVSPYSSIEDVRKKLVGTTQLEAIQILTIMSKTGISSDEYHQCLKKATELATTIS